MFEQIRAKIASRIRGDAGKDFEDVARKIERAPTFAALVRLLNREEVSPVYALAKCSDEECEWWDNEAGKLF